MLSSQVRYAPSRQSDSCCVCVNYFIAIIACDFVFSTLCSWVKRHLGQQQKQQQYQWREWIECGASDKLFVVFFHSIIFDFTPNEGEKARGCELLLLLLLL